MVLVVERDVVDDILVLPPHLLDAVLDDVGHLVCEGRVPSNNCRVRERYQQGVSILVLQALTVEGRASRCGAQQEAACTGISRLPDEVSHALEAEHGVVDEERHHGTSLGRVGRARRDPTAQCARLADAFLQHLAVRCLRILHHLVVVHRCVVLPEGCVDLELVEESVHPEGPRLIGDHGDATLAKVPALHELPQQPRKGHGRAPGLRVALVEHLVVLGRWKLNEAADLRRRPQWQVASKLNASLVHVLHLCRL
mmetsp:Transcript_54262/g.126330  ORF Transcript_54262/g.126330 Transcript_54262/m.126330 type:complete len:254 (-) Transcript_54262:968-1729(-)